MAPDTLFTVPFELSGGGIALFDRQHYATYEHVGDIWKDKFETEAKQNVEIHDGRLITALVDGGRYDVSFARRPNFEPLYASPHIIIEEVFESQGYWLDVPSGELVVTDFAALKDWKNLHQDASRDGFHSTGRIRVERGAYRLAVEAYFIAGNPFNRASVALPDENASEPQPVSNLRAISEKELRFVRHIVFNFTPMTKRMAISMRKTAIHPPEFMKDIWDYKEALDRLKAAMTKKE